MSHCKMRATDQPAVYAYVIFIIALLDSNIFSRKKKKKMCFPLFTLFR